MACVKSIPSDEKFRTAASAFRRFPARLSPRSREPSDEPGDRRPGRQAPGERLPLAKQRERPHDARVRFRGRLRAVGEAPAGPREPVERLVIDAEHRTAQRGEQRNGVLRVGQGFEGRHERGELRRRSEGFSAAEDAGDAAALERLRVQEHELAPAEEQEEVLRPALSGRDGGRDEVGDPRGVRPGAGLVAAARAGSVDPENGRLGSVLPALGLERHVRGLFLATVLREERGPGEHAIDPGAESRGRAEVRREPEDPAAGLDARAHGVIGLDVRPAEAIDGLLRIADDEERAGQRHELLPVLLLRVRAGQVEEDLRLDRVRILEFVDEDRRETFAQGASDLGVVPQQLAGGEEEVLEVGESGLPPPVAVSVSRLRQQGAHFGMDVLRPGHQGGLDDLLPQYIEGFLQRRRRALFRVEGAQDLQDPRELGRALRVHEREEPLRAANRMLESAPPSGRRLGRQGLSGPLDERYDLRAGGREIGLRAARAGRYGDIGVLADRFEGARKIPERNVEFDQPLEARIACQKELFRETLPGLASGGAVLRLVELREAGVQARLDRPLAQEPRAEGMDRSDETGIEPREGLGQPARLQLSLLPPESLLQGVLEALLQLRGCPDRERDGGKVVYGRRALRDQGDHPLHEALGLAGSRGGLDENRGGEVLADRPARRLVGEVCGEDPVSRSLCHSSLGMRPARGRGGRRASRPRARSPPSCRRRSPRSRRTCSCPPSGHGGTSRARADRRAC
jgi:hypothetical protein